MSILWLLCQNMHQTARKKVWCKLITLGYQDFTTTCSVYVHSHMLCSSKRLNSWCCHVKKCFSQYALLACCFSCSCTLKTFVPFGAPFCPTICITYLSCMCFLALIPCAWHQRGSILDGKVPSAEFSNKGNASKTGDGYCCVTERNSKGATVFRM